MRHRNKPNSWITELTGGTPQLTYALQVNPAPLIVSVSGADPVLASLEFVVTNPTGNTLEVDSVTFTLQVGPASDCITTTTSGINTAVSDTTDWTVTGPSSIITSGSATYTLAPTTGSSVSLAAGASVVVQLFQVQTNTVAGNSTVAIKEIVGSTPGFTNFLVPTFPDSFFFNGLAASVQSGATLTPVAQIATGDTITLTWNSSVIDISAFYILYSSAGQGQQKANPSDIGEWTSPALTDDTVFTVVVTTSLTGGQPLTASMSIGVSIQNRSIVAASVASNTVNVSGSIDIGGSTTANSITATGISVNGALSANSATVNGALNSASLNVSGNSVLASANVSGGLSVGGSTSMASASVGGSLNVGGNFVANSGNVSMMTGASMLAQGVNIGQTGIQALTDGFAVAFVDFLPNNCTAMSYNFAYVYAAGNWFSIQGGNVGQFGPGWDDYMGSNSNTMCIPISSGSYWYYYSQSLGDNQANANTQIWWFPIGSNATGATFRALSDGEIEAPPPPANPNVTSREIIIGKRKESAGDFISKLGSALGVTIDKKTESELVDSLLSF